GVGGGQPRDGRVAGVLGRGEVAGQPLHDEGEGGVVQGEPVQGGLVRGAGLEAVGLEVGGPPPAARPQEGGGTAQGGQEGVHGLGGAAGGVVAQDPGGEALEQGGVGGHAGGGCGLGPRQRREKEGPYSEEDRSERTQGGACKLTRTASGPAQQQANDAVCRGLKLSEENCEMLVV